MNCRQKAYQAGVDCLDKARCTFPHGCEGVCYYDALELVDRLCSSNNARPHFSILHADMVRGSDTEGDGSLEKPYKSLRVAVREANYGTTVILGPGTWRLGKPLDVPDGVSIKGRVGVDEKNPEKSRTTLSFPKSEVTVTFSGTGPGYRLDDIRLLFDDQVPTKGPKKGRDKK